MIGALVRTVVIMSVTGGLAVVALLALKPVMRHRLPKWAQYYLWLVVLVALFVPVSRLLVLPETGVSPPLAPVHDLVNNSIVTVGEQAAGTDLGADLGPGAEAPPATNSGQSQSPWRVTASVFIYLYPWVVAAVLAYNIIIYGFFTAKVRRHRTRAGKEELYELVGLAGDAMPPRLYRCAIITTPMLVGIIKPELVLPDRTYTHAELQSVLRHELTHLRRRDVVVKWLMVLACALHWFNPLVWWMRREVDRVCELACDEAVVRGLDPVSKQAYGETLIAVAASSLAPKAVLSTMMCEEKKNLKERLLAIMKSKNQVATVSIVSVAVIIVAFMATSALAAGRANDAGAAAPTATSPTSSSGQAKENQNDIIQLYPDQVASYFNLTKRDLIDELGPEYEVRDSANEGGYEVLYFATIGLEFEFVRWSGDDQTVTKVACGKDRPCGLSGANTTMTFQEISQALGEAEVYESYDESGEVIYGLQYLVGNLDCYFHSSDVEGRTGVTLNMASSITSDAPPYQDEGGRVYPGDDFVTPAEVSGDFAVSEIILDSDAGVYLLDCSEVVRNGYYENSAPKYAFGDSLVVGIEPSEMVTWGGEETATMDEFYRGPYHDTDGVYFGHWFLFNAEAMDFWGYGD
ncbi:MAG: M56 family metallopeptidase [Micrococcales bacterium]|nr:M56 family metallopeptidase [Micrococcales bacterium]